MSDYRDLPLGKHTDYPDQYDPSQLCAIPRARGRAELSAPRLPMHGSDLWNAYELSWLDSSGKPQVACAQFLFPADSPNMVESKSLKLYLNSFNQTQVESAQRLAAILQDDLGRTAQAEVQVELLLPERWLTHYALSEPEGESLDDLHLPVLADEPDSGLLKSSGKRGDTQVYTNLFRSCCPVTGQPDWATVTIALTGELPKAESLLSYLTSFRQNNEFHEQCVERIYSDLSLHFELDALTVQARYTRRGGLDINPVRSSHASATAFQRLARQ